MHATLDKFGYPQGSILETPHWAVLLRPVQCTLGALVLCSKSDSLSLPALPAPAFDELREVCQALEQALAGAFSHEKINYLMLMMVDPHVHFHVIPRYSAARSFAGRQFTDSGWPGPPELAAGDSLDPGLRTELLGALKLHLPDLDSRMEPDTLSPRPR